MIKNQTGIQFKDCDFSEVDINHADISKAGLSNCSLLNTIIDQTNLLGADLRDAFKLQHRSRK